MPTPAPRFQSKLAKLLLGFAHVEEDGRPPLAREVVLIFDAARHHAGCAVRRPSLSRGEMDSYL